MKKYLNKNHYKEILTPSILVTGIFLILTIISPKIKLFLPIIVISIIFEFIYLKEVFTIRKQQILIMCFMCVVVISMLMAKEQFSMNYIFPYMAFGGFYVLVTLKSYTSKQLNYFSHCIELGGILACLLIIINGKAYYGQELRYTIILATGPQDPNFTSILLCLPLIVFLLRVYYNPNKFNCIICSTGALLLMFTIVLTGSRTGMIALTMIIITMFISALLKYKKEKKIKLTWGKVIVILVIVAIILSTIILILPDQIIGRIFNYNNLYQYDNSSIIAGSPRLNIWINAIEILFHRPIVGFGLGMNDYYLLQHSGLITALHNTFIDVWFQFGIIGFVMYIYIFFNFVKCIFITKCYPLTTLIFVLLVGCMFLDMFYGREIWIILMTLSLYLNYIKDSNMSIKSVFGGNSCEC